MGADVKIKIKNKDEKVDKRLLRTLIYNLISKLTGGL